MARAPAVPADGVSSHASGHTSGEPPMSRPAPRVLSPAEQAETDRVAEEVLREIKRVLSRPSALAHPV